MAQAFAPAKVNLYLHVGAADGQGFHPLASLAAFADVGDRLTAEPAQRFSYRVEGPFADGLGGEDDLVLRAVDALGRGRPPLALRLWKALPLASGLGGGTGDGAAALRLLRATVWPDLTEDALEAAARTLGSDGPACLAARTLVMEGCGERLSAGPTLPPLPAVLVNPGVACPTGAVYRAYDAGERVRTAERVDPPALRTPGEVAGWLAGETRNDLQAAAAVVQPAVAEVLAALEGAAEARLARMSGSGATCFALCGDAAAAERLAARLVAERPGWWVRACRLGDVGREPERR